MAETANIEFIKWGCKAIVNWEFAGELTCPVYQIHGEQDQLISVESVKADKVIPGAGHLLNVTHPNEVNEFIREKINHP